MTEYDVFQAALVTTLVLSPLVVALVVESAIGPPTTVEASIIYFATMFLDIMLMFLAAIYITTMEV